MMKRNNISIENLLSWSSIGATIAEEVSSFFIAKIKSDLLTDEFSDLATEEEFKVLMVGIVAFFCAAQIHILSCSLDQKSQDIMRIFEKKIESALSIISEPQDSFPH